MQESTNVSFKKAVHAARFIIKSRTGVAILKKNYQEKSDPILEKSTQLLKGSKAKEMRKLERDMTQFVNGQSEKFKNGDKASESLTQRTAQKIVIKETKDTANEKIRTQRPRLNGESVCQSMKYNTEAVLYRRDVFPVFEKRSKLAWDESDNKENKQETLKTPTLTRKKILNHNLSSYTENKRLEMWLNEVEIANLERREEVAGRNRKKRKERHVEQESNSSQQPQRLLLPKCEDKKSQSDASCKKLELPKLEQCRSSTENSINLPKIGQSVTPDSSRDKSKIEESLSDPRFTRLMDSLTPSKSSLKLPQIIMKPNSRSA